MLHFVEKCTTILSSQWGVGLHRLQMEAHLRESCSASNKCNRSPCLLKSNLFLGKSCGFSLSCVLLPPPLSVLTYFNLYFLCTGKKSRKLFYWFEVLLSLLIKRCSEQLMKTCSKIFLTLTIEKTWQTRNMGWGRKKKKCKLQFWKQPLETQVYIPRSAAWGMEKRHAVFLFWG